jgi:monofunctional glycosyltransferase
MDKRRRRTQKVGAKPPRKDAARAGAPAAQQPVDRDEENEETFDNAVIAKAAPAKKSKEPDTDTDGDGDVEPVIQKPRQAPKRPAVGTSPFASRPAAAKKPSVAKKTAGLGAPSRFKSVARKLMKAVAIVCLIPIVLTLIYAVVPPPFSNLMLLRSVAGYGLNKDWVSLDEMSPSLARTVITSEDARFCSHSGVDWTEMNHVFEDVFDDDEGAVRGASTISMQTAKNLFLWDGRSILRKGLEVPLAMWMDLVWSKRRMIEIYLNIVEWAPGVYGAEAAAQHHFKKSAKKLNRREAALLAAVLPNPIKRKAGKPSRRVLATASRIQGRVADTEPYLTCVP